MADDIGATVTIDLQERRIMLFGDIYDGSASEIIAALMAMNNGAGVSVRKAAAHRLEPIEFWIQSHGGSTSCAFTIVDVMRHIVDADIVAVGMGRVCSAAIYPLLFADQRLVFPLTEIVIHSAAQSVNDFGGRETASHLRLREAHHRAAAESAEWTDAQIVVALVERCGWDPLRAHKLVTDGADHFFMGGRAIVAAGLADAVLGEPTEVKS